jgi:hypothetical protein
MPLMLLQYLCDDTTMLPSHPFVPQKANTPRHSTNDQNQQPALINITQAKTEKESRVAGPGTDVAGASSALGVLNMAVTSSSHPNSILSYS